MLQPGFIKEVVKTSVRDKEVKGKQDAGTDKIPAGAAQTDKKLQPRFKDLLFNEIQNTNEKQKTKESEKKIKTKVEQLLDQIQTSSKNEKVTKELLAEITRLLKDLTALSKDENKLNSKPANDLLKKIRLDESVSLKEIKDVLKDVLKELNGLLQTGLFSKVPLNQPDAKPIQLEKTEKDKARDAAADKPITEVLSKNDRKQAVAEIPQQKQEVVIIDLRQKAGITQEIKSKRDEKQENSFKIKFQPESVELKEKDSVKPFQDISYFSGSQANGIKSDSTGTDIAAKQVLNPQDAARLKEVLQSEIVKNTGILLKDNDTGEIRLVLKPESLGRVRIKVNLENNNIDGKIFVENSMIREIVESSLEKMNTAFKESGFNNIALQVSVENGPGNKENMQPFFYQNPKSVTDEFEKTIPVLSDYDNDFSYVNLII